MSHTIAMDLRTRRRHLLVVICVLVMTIIAVLSLAHPIATGLADEDTVEGVAPPGESADEPPVDQPRDDGLGEPDEVYEDVEGPPALDDKE